MPSSAQATRYDELWTGVYGEMQELGPVHRHMRRLLGERLRPLGYRTALDVGCGAGDNASLLRAGGAPLERLVGVDVSARALERARARDP